MKLLIVESPAKAKTIEKYLGGAYKVLSSCGHIRSLPSVKDAIEPENNFKITYEILKKAKETIKILSENFKKAETILLATDPDREGEAIAWHILEAMKSQHSIQKDATIKRVVFYEITKSAVIKAIDNPRELDRNLIHAQQARQALDYLVGFTLSPILWRKLPGSKSAGRVQSVALKLLCERENERDMFQKQEYWPVNAKFQNQTNIHFNACLTMYKEQKFDKMQNSNKTDAQVIVQNIEHLRYAVSSIKRKKINKHPTAPFITSTLIQEASKKLNFTAQKTMLIAQKLYEGVKINDHITGLITYIRTDSTTMSKDSIQSTITYIKNHYGVDYLPLSPIIYKSKSKNAQEAHEAIRPTDFQNNPNTIEKFLDNNQYKLYELIWKKAIASQMANARLESMTIDITSEDSKNTFKSVGSTLVFDGFYKIYKEYENINQDQEQEQEQSQNIIPQLEKNDILEVMQINTSQHFTQPPPRYNEASIVKKMEELGIGRPSTYPKIISILIERQYTRIIKKSFVLESKGRIVDAFLSKFFKKYIDYDFTANLENDLDDIANGKKDWKEILVNFWFPFQNTASEVLNIKNIDIINAVEESLVHYIFKTNSVNELVNLRKCNICHNGELGLKTGKFGAFIGCSNYPECNSKRVLFVNQESENITDNDRILGIDSQTKVKIILKKGPYGFYLEKEEGTGRKRASLPTKYPHDKISLEFASNLLRLPKVMGKHPTINQDILMKIGKYGGYLECNKKFYAIKDEQINILVLSNAIKIINDHQSKIIKHNKDTP